jgi:hypothetical protein
LFEHNLGDTVEQCGLVRYVPVQHRRVSAHLVAEAAHGQAVDTVTVDDPQCSSQDHRPAYLAVMLAGRRGGRLGCVSACIRHGRPLRLLGHYVASHNIVLTGSVNNIHIWTSGKNQRVLEITTR